MKKISPKVQKFLLAVFFVLGGTFTFELTVDRVRENHYLYAVMAVFAILFDVLFFKTLFALMRQRAIPMLLDKVSKAFSFVFSRVGKLIERIGGNSSSKDKIFMDGKNEWGFVFEVYSNKTAQVRRKLPKLPKDADERQKIRYEYTCYVFKKDKNISSVLTPNEVASYLDETGEDRELFERYNVARYTE